MTIITPSILPAKIPPPATSSPTPIIHTPFDPNPLLLPQRCRTLPHLRQLHARLLKSGPRRRPASAEHLLEAAALLVPGALGYARDLFDRMPDRTSAAYTIMIRGLTANRTPEEALSLFRAMMESSVAPDKYSFSCTLKACSRLKAMREGEQVHGLIVKSGLSAESFVLNTLIHMYASCGEAGVARRVFDGICDKNNITWNAMFAGYSKSGGWDEVVRLFRDMVDLGVPFDEVTLIIVLTACGRVGDLQLGEFISGHFVSSDIQGSMNLVTSLVDMYAKCGQLDRARELFDDMPQRDVVAWSAMISGYSQASRCREALELFHEMQLANVEPNEVTMVSVLASCAVLGALETGKWVHSFIKRKSLELTVNLGTALVDFYAKCGAIGSALAVFEKMPQKNVLSWTVLILGLANNGQGSEALRLFSTMLEASVQPNDVTFIGVLSACSHAGLVEEGREYFNSMSRDHNIIPRIDHYGCMVDILGRAGLIDDALHFIKMMPIEPNAIVWRTLLASCRVHKNVEIGEKALKEIIKLEPTHSGDYILLSNIYASIGRFEDASRVRSDMKEKGIKKTPGCTLIEVEGIIYEFFAEDSEHPQSKEIYDKVEEMMSRIKLAGYVPNTAEARLDAEEDEKEASISHHSEKLAIAFGLIKSSTGTAIRISKNLRVCSDCHAATKFISKVYKREIVVRDRNRFHHFKNGTCSCNDYW